jgi:hypothetical protein
MDRGSSFACISLTLSLSLSLSLTFTRLSLRRKTHTRIHTKSGNVLLRIIRNIIPYPFPFLLGGPNINNIQKQTRFHHFYKRRRGSIVSYFWVSLQGYLYTHTHSLSFSLLRNQLCCSFLAVWIYLKERVSSAPNIIIKKWHSTNVTITPPPSLYPYSPYLKKKKLWTSDQW